MSLPIIDDRPTPGCSRLVLQDSDESFQSAMARSGELRFRISAKLALFHEYSGMMALPATVIACGASLLALAAHQSSLHKSVMICDG